MKYFLTQLCLILCISINAQLSENFDDGELVVNPTWNGTINHYHINENQELQSNNTVAGTSYLSTLHNLNSFDNKEWNIWIKHSFAGSSNNYSRIYLLSSSPNLSVSPDGIYLQLGEAGSADAIRLMEQFAGNTTEILSGFSGEIAAAFDLTIGIRRSEIGEWSLFVDENENNLTNFISSGIEQNEATGSYFGILNTYTASNATKFYFDNIYIGNYQIDTLPPTISTLEIISSTQLDLIFNEPIALISAQNQSNYDLTNHTIIEAIKDNSNPKLVHLTINPALNNGDEENLSVQNIEDNFNNTSAQEVIQFFYLIAEIPEIGDVIINEFLCDPSPSVGLPEVEYVEIINNSSKYFSLKNWKLGDENSFGTLQEVWLYPDSVLVLIGNESIELFQNSCGVINFPSLNNSGDQIILTDNNGIILDQITYTDEWYQDGNKKEGGYSLERINPFHPCSNKTNWKASISDIGGTPGIINSVLNLNPDATAPVIETLTVVNDSTILIGLNEETTETSISTFICTTSPSLSIHNLEATLDNHYLLYFNDEIITNYWYQIHLEGIKDCWGNELNQSTQFIQCPIPSKGDLIINEILFNPPIDCVDYIELKNNSSKTLDLKGISISTIKNNGTITTETIQNSYYLDPESIVLISEDTLQVQESFLNGTCFGHFIQTEIPALLNDSTSIRIHYDTILIDSLTYHENWHFELLDNYKGKSLERINPNENTQLPSNWHTASETIGFGTPGCENSQNLQSTDFSDFFVLSHDILSPNNDGIDDLLAMNYHLPFKDMLANCIIYNDSGREIHSVFKQQLMNPTGTFYWDGILDNNNKLETGTYILVFDAFNLTGERLQKRIVFSVLL
jgi:hypothetical protein